MDSSKLVEREWSAVALLNMWTNEVDEFGFSDLQKLFRVRYTGRL